FDRDFPRTISYAAVGAADFARRLGELHPGRSKGVDRAFGKLAARLEYADVAEVEGRGTALFLKEIGSELGDASGLLQSSYFLR
ncbi:MAG TPA: alpha-E domain-containing protein, partial [Polyangiaceae bacterium]|nr:alpha-E domain-containing protein [Polyangiaceae bacterium]